MKQKIAILFIMTFTILTFKNYDLILKSSLDGLYIWLYKVFPYLFIMIIIEDLLINLNFAKCFKNTSLYIFFMSLISGSPTGTYIISKLYKQNMISKKYAEITLIFTFFANPLFLYTILGSIFANTYITIKIIFILYFTNFLLYLYYKKSLPKNDRLINKVDINLSTSIKTSINTTITVLGVIIFYLILSNILIKELNIIYPFNILFKGLLEMTQGLAALINTNTIYKELLTCLFISFGGFSIHTQILAILSDANLSYKPFLKGRIIQTILVIIFIIIT